MPNPAASLIAARPAFPWRALRFLVLLTGLLAFAPHGANAAVTVKFEQKDGDKVSDIAKIVAKAESPDGIDKVEFRVDDQLRYSDTSTPYEYEWDTIADKEGAHTLTATAFDSNGQTARATVKLTVDNEIALGADALAKQAQEALANKDPETAKRYSRRALKADPGNIAGARSLAALYVTTRDYDKAIATLEKATTLESSSEGMLELASYKMRRALIPENASKFFSEVQSVGELRHKAADLAVSDVIKKYQGTNTPAAHDAVGDALMNAGRFHEAASEYNKSGVGDDTPVASLNRLGLALAMDNRPADAVSTLKSLQLGKRDDAQTRAVMGLAYLRMLQFTEARDIIKKDLADHGVATLIVASYADGVIGNTKLAIDEAKDAINLAPTLGEANYALSLATVNVPALANDYDAALGQSLSLSPFQAGPYLEYAGRQLFQKRADKYDQALNLTDLVLKADTDNVNAKVMQSMIYISQKRLPEALPVLQDLQKNHVDSADVLTALSIYSAAKVNPAAAGQYMDAARKADPVHFNLNNQPTAVELLTKLRRLHYRAGFYLTPAALYPPQA